MRMRNGIGRRIAAVWLCLSVLCGVLASCGQAVDTAHTICVKTVGGMPLEDVGVFVYKDSHLTELVWAAQTDEDGMTAFTAASSEYTVVLKDVPEGYDVQEQYTLTDEQTVILLETMLSDDSDLFERSFQRGDVMSDFSVTATNGVTYTLSELLKTHKAVVLNFWFIHCGPCKTEFPYLQQAYDAYKDDVAVLAINPYDGTDDTVAAYAEELGLTFPVISGDERWQTCMRLTAYPTTVVIDRFGTIGLIHKGSITQTEGFAEIFDYFCAEDYVQTTVQNISDLPSFT